IPRAVQQAAHYPLWRGAALCAPRERNGDIPMDLGLKGKRAIVVGGSRGIGKAIARELASEGVDIALVARSRTPLENAAQELRAETGCRIVPLIADVTRRDQVDDAIRQAGERLGGFDILINSGSTPGGKATGAIESINDEEF